MSTASLTACAIMERSFEQAVILTDMSLDPVDTNPEHYKVVFENDRVRILEYTDQPGEMTAPHDHPDSVMYTLSSFRRRLVSGEVQREVELTEGSAGWLPAQQHYGENIGDTPTHVIFVELKEPSLVLRGQETEWVHVGPKHH
jgi:quercetin dioxygenase-like cupin family protein